MEGVVALVLLLQIILSIPIGIPIIRWFWLKRSIIQTDGSDRDAIAGVSTCILLPMRNECSNVIRKLDSVIGEILPYDCSRILVIDSNSSDNTGDLAKSHLEKSKLPRDRWGVKILNVSGKNYALNSVIGEISEQITIISDADAQVEPGWLQAILSRLAEENVAAVSGIEIPKHAKNFNSYYREKSNQMKCLESELGSTPVLEGSILAWESDVLKEFRLNQDMNADDAQIALHCIKKGYRAIVDREIKFRNFEQKERTFRESVRRAQGLSLSLVKNISIIYRDVDRHSKNAFLNTFVLYVIVPWCMIFLLILNATWLFLGPSLGLIWDFYPVFLLIGIFLAPGGRFFMRGVTISIIAHIQAMFGIKYHSWDPVR